MEKRITSLSQDYSGKSPAEYSPLVLAYIGDAVYEVYIRSLLVSRGSFPVHQLHKAATGYVKAEAQSKAVQVLVPELSEEELRIYKRGRNAKPGTVAKHAEVKDYHQATGFEALIGYLYLQKNDKRLEELLQKAVDGLEQEANPESVKK